MIYWIDKISIWLGILLGLAVPILLLLHTFIF